MVNPNSKTIENELNWLVKLIDYRLEVFFTSSQQMDQPLPNPPDLNTDTSALSRFIETELSPVLERIVLAVSLAYYFKPEIFDKFLIRNKPINKPFTEFGGVYQDRSFFLPTLGTAAFIFGGTELNIKLNFGILLDNNHIFKRKNIIEFEDSEKFGTLYTKIIRFHPEFLFTLSTGLAFKPNYTSDFPADLIQTELDWDDLVFDSQINAELKTINSWLTHRSELANNPILAQKMSLGYKCLFYGPPGTGKTITAALLGKTNYLDVYRIDLSQLVSKYIGETEKNLGRIFDMAENKRWILFFDEAESIFSKRTAVGDSKDKFANQQTAYLLQRIENYNGLVILASNLKPNIDQAFTRRLQAFINFPIPNVSNRKRIWSNYLKGIMKLDQDEIDQISKPYELSGGSIKNVIQYAWLTAKADNVEMTINHILNGIKRELNKQGKSFEY